MHPGHIFSPSEIFGPVRIVEVPAIRKFTCRTIDSISGFGGDRIQYRGQEYPAWFHGKVERNIMAATLRGTTLLQRSSNEQIIEVLGGEAKVKTSVGQLRWLAQQQPKGEEAGILLADGRTNAILADDARGETRLLKLVFSWAAVERKETGHWILRALPRTDLCLCPVGTQFIILG